MVKRRISMITNLHNNCCFSNSSRGLIHGFVVDYLGAEFYASALIKPREHFIVFKTQNLNAHEHRFESGNKYISENYARDTGSAGEKIYHYIWNTIADKILEENKSRLSSADERDKQSAQLMLFRLLETSLIILHPFMPFVTEEIWQSLPERKTPLIIAPWPSY